MTTPLRRLRTAPLLVALVLAMAGTGRAAEPPDPSEAGPSEGPQVRIGLGYTWQSVAHRGVRARREASGHGLGLEVAAGAPIAPRLVLSASLLMQSSPSGEVVIDDEAAPIDRHTTFFWGLGPSFEWRIPLPTATPATIELGGAFRLGTMRFWGSRPGIFLNPEVPHEHTDVGFIVDGSIGGSAQVATDWWVGGRVTVGYLQFGPDEDAPPMTGPRVAVELVVSFR